MPDSRPSLQRQDASFFATARRRFRNQERWKQILELTATVCTILGLPIAIIVPILLESPAPAPAPAPDPPVAVAQTEQLKCGVSVLGSTAGSDYAEEPSCDDAQVPGRTKARGRWFALVGGGSDVSLSTCNSYSGASYDTRLRVYRDGDLGRVCVAGNDDDGSCDHGGQFSAVTFSAELGFTYLVLVDGRQPEGGDFVLDVNCEDDSSPTDSPAQTLPPAPTPVAVVTTQTQTSSPTDLAPTPVPTTQTLFNILSSNSQDGGAALRTEGTPQRMAYEWLALDLDVVESYGFVKLFERYSLTVLYYSTGGSEWWDSVNWLNDYNHCNWYGVECNYINIVETLDLQDNKLEGSIPPEIWMLTKIFKLWIPDNVLTGTIPTHIGRLSNAVQISLSSNSLGGVIPTEMGNLEDLVSLRLSNNNFNENIPTQLGNLKNLETLYLFGNKLTGTMPAEICALRDGKLATLSVDCTSDVLCDCCTSC